MAATKRTPAQRQLDREWMAAEAAACRVALAPTAMKRHAEAEGRESIAQLSVVQIFQDIRSMSEAAWRSADDANAALLERTKQELSRLAFADLRQVLEWGPDGVTFKSSDDLDEDAAALVSSVTVKTRRENGEDGAELVEAKLDTHGKVAALAQLMKYLTPAQVLKLQGAGETEIRFQVVIPDNGRDE